MEQNQQSQTSGTPDCPPAQHTAEHDWLQQLVGDWECEFRSRMAPDQPEHVHKGTESVRSLGGLWTIGDGVGDMGGDQMLSITTLGYDPDKGRFVGSFIANVMTFMWQYTGSRNGNTLTLDCVGPDMSPGAQPGAMADYQDIIEIVDGNTRTLKSQVKSPGGWVEFMWGTYKRM
jgi:hypothetical protein